ncbi:MAG: extracellular solute-binding protein [Chloroflexi bacterium]|nr:extracellular solute-binding protein [Chloroflexota bacterium]
MENLDRRRLLGTALGVAGTMASIPLLSACGATVTAATAATSSSGTVSATSSSAATTTATRAAQAPPKAGSKALTITYGQFEVFKTQWDMHVAIINEFNKTHPNIYVKLQGPTYQKMLTEVAAHDAPDLVNTYSELTLGPKGALIDQSAFIARDKKYEQLALVPQALHYYEYKGKIYGAPTAIATQQCLYYNEDLLKKAGVKPPSDTVWTFQEYTDAALKLQKSFGANSNIFASAPLNNFDYAVYANGGRVWSSDGTQLLIGSKEARDAYQWSWDLLLKHKVAPAQAEVSSLGGTGGLVTMFETGHLAMFFSDPYPLSPLKKVTAFKWGVGPGIKGTKHPCQVIIYPLDITTTAKTEQERQAAFDVIDYYATSDFANNQILTTHYGIPFRKDWAAKAKYPLKVFVDLATHNDFVYLERPYPNVSEFNTKYATPVWQSVALGKLPVNAAIDKILADYKTFMQQYNKTGY